MMANLRITGWDILLGLVIGICLPTLLQALVPRTSVSGIIYWQHQMVWLIPISAFFVCINNNICRNISRHLSSLSFEPVTAVKDITLHACYIVFASLPWIIIFITFIVLVYNFLSSFPSV